jgi:nitroreductase
MDSQELLRIIYNRRSVRKYERKPVPDDVLRAVLEAGRQAPSARNLQPYCLIVVRDPELKRKLVFSEWNRFIEEAPVVIVGCGDSRAKWAVVDVAIALQNMVIAAEALGLGTCWVGHFIEEDVKKALKIPERMRVVAMITLGYPDEKPAPRPKKSLGELVRYETYE